MTKLPDGVLPPVPLPVELSQIEVEPDALRRQLGGPTEVVVGGLPARLVEGLRPHERAGEQALDPRQAHHLVVELPQHVVRTTVQGIGGQDPVGVVVDDLGQLHRVARRRVHRPPARRDTVPVDPLEGLRPDVHGALRQEDGRIEPGVLGTTPAFPDPQRHGRAGRPPQRVVVRGVYREALLETLEGQLGLARHIQHVGLDDGISQGSRLPAQARGRQKHHHGEEGTWDHDGRAAEEKAGGGSGTPRIPPDAAVCLPLPTARWTHDSGTMTPDRLEPWPRVVRRPR